MKVSDLLESRRANWRTLEILCEEMAKLKRRGPDAATVARFAALYRSACADLALADSYHLPPSTVEYLHRLVGRAHNQLYRSRKFHFASWTHQLLVDVPQRLFNDNCLRLAFCVFWGMFLLSGFLAMKKPGFSEQVVGKETLSQLEEMYANPTSRANVVAGPGGSMAGFYIYHNTSIGFQCFAFGLLCGVGGLYITMYNAAILGTIFGHMANVPAPTSDNFFHFVTAHGPFELTAIVLSAAAGMRLGFSIVDTGGLTRGAALQGAAKEAMPTMGAAAVMFVAAAMIEAFLSPSMAPYWVKATVAVLSAGLLIFYFLGLGYPRGE